MFYLFFSEKLTLTEEHSSQPKREDEQREILGTVCSGKTRIWQMRLHLSIYIPLGEVMSTGSRWQKPDSLGSKDPLKLGRSAGGRRRHRVLPARVDHLQREVRWQEDRTCVLLDKITFTLLQKKRENLSKLKCPINFIFYFKIHTSY